MAKPYSVFEWWLLLMVIGLALLGSFQIGRHYHKLQSFAYQQLTE